jgi:DNA-binding NarL/FixJ family response regulator
VAQKGRRTAIGERADDLTRILLVEDHASFRQALAFMFEREPEFKVVGEAGSVAEVRELPGESLRDVEVAVVDLALPDGDGLELIEDFSSREPRIMMLVLSASLEPGRFARAVEAGADGVLHKSTPIRDIVDAVRALKAGEALLSPAEILEMLRLVSHERQEKREARQAIEKLTPREIAEKMNITVETERTHMVNILHKLGVHSRLHALLFAVRHGIVQIN